MCRDNSHHPLKYFCLVFACDLYEFLCYMSPIFSKMVIFLFQPILVAIFVTIATVKNESKSDLYTLAFVLIN